MHNFDFLLKYISTINDPNNSNKKHIFYKLDNDVVEAEQRLGKQFPDELRHLYLTVGYGFLCNLDKTHRDRLMDPHSI